jgi:hypothetical protein
MILGRLSTKKAGMSQLFLWRWANYSGDFLGFKIILQSIEYNGVNEDM